jgi:hypothetical protein
MRNSAHWQQDLKLLGRNFYNKKLNKVYSSCIRYDETKFDNVSEYCDGMVDALKNEMYPDGVNKSDCLIDRHKVAAAHVLGFLKNQIFEKNPTTPDESIFDRLANEYYCLLAFQAIITGWNGKRGVAGKFQIPEKESDYILKLFYQYKKLQLLRVPDTTIAFFFSGIIYFAEKCFFKTPAGKGA